MSALTANVHTPADASGGNITLTLPTTANDGDEVSVEKYDSSTNTVTITGTIRTTSSASISMTLSKETIGFRAKNVSGTVQWWPIFGHKVISTLDARYDASGAASAAQAAAATDATTKANTAQSNAQTYADQYSGSAVGTSNKPLAATDSTTTNARTPTAHASTHATGGSDVVSPSSIGAQPTSSKDVANGYAGLDGSALLKIVEFPNIDGGTQAARNLSISPRRGTAANWTSANPTLNAGEFGLETDSGALKIGDGSTAWTSLAYAGQQLPSGLVILSNTASNLLYYAAAGANLPTFTSRSNGNKIVLYPLLSATSVDFAIGIATNLVWHSVPQNTATYSFKWYAGTTNVATLDGTGAFTAVGRVTGLEAVYTNTVSAGNFRDGYSLRSTTPQTVTNTTSGFNPCDCTSTAIAVSLYNASTSPGQRFTYVKIDSGANTVAISVASSGTINGAATFTLSNQFDYVVLESTSTAGVWYVVATNVGFVNTTGAQTIAGNKTFSGSLTTISGRLAVTATGSRLGSYTSISTATTLSTSTHKYVELTAAAAVPTLPTSASSTAYDFVIINTYTSAINVTAASGDTIGNTTGATNTYALAAGAAVRLVATGGTAWRVI